MLLITKFKIETVRDNFPKNTWYTPHLRGILNFLIKEHSSIKKETTACATRPADLEAVDIELDDHHVDIPAEYKDKYIKIIMCKLTDCADVEICESNNPGFKTVYY